MKGGGLSLSRRLDELSFEDRTVHIEHKQYASPYYDPVKAHEYYEQHKQLKGNRRSTSTASLNEKGKKAALYVKSKIDEEHKSELTKHKEDVTAQRDAAKADTKSKVDAATKELKSKTEALKVRLKKMNPAQRKQAEIHARAEIERMKKENEENRKALMEEYGEISKGISEASAKTRGEIGDKYHNKYADEIDAIKKDASMIKPKKGKSSKSGGKYIFEYRKDTVAAQKAAKKKK